MSPGSTAGATNSNRKDANSTAPERRRIAIRALGDQLNSAPCSAASRLGAMLSETRPMVISGDIDGLVSAAMLASVAPGFDIVAIVIEQSRRLLLHPSVAAGMPDDLFGVDVFSTQFDNVSNHVVEFGTKQYQVPEVRQAFNDWDAAVHQAAQTKLLAVPSIWAKTQGGYETRERADASTYKYPLGTAQLLLALLEAAGNSPRFFDRTYLPWLVANCDGGIATYNRYAFNARIWWPVMAGAVGPWSLTEQIFRMVDTMRPHDFLDAVHRLDRERQASGMEPWLNDDWNLAGHSVAILQRALNWLTDLTGWRDPVRGGISNLTGWRTVPVASSGQVYYATRPKDSVLQGNPHHVVHARSDPTLAANLIRGATSAVNANFYLGGQTGSRFNWIGGW